MSTVRFYTLEQDDWMDYDFDRVPCVGERLRIAGKTYEVRQVTWELSGLFVASLELRKMSS